MGVTVAPQYQRALNNSPILKKFKKLKGKDVNEKSDLKLPGVTVLWIKQIKE